MKKDVFFEKMDELGLALSYSDVRLRTGYSEVTPGGVDVRTKFSRNVTLNCPIVSSPMDTVTEHKMAIEMAKLGGLGIIHRALSPKEQASEVARVKFCLNGLIRRPICVNADEKMEIVMKMIDEKDFKFRSFPVIDGNGKVIGLLTSNDFEFCADFQMSVEEVMSKDLISVNNYPPLENVFQIMRENKKKVLPVIDGNGFLIGMYVYSDIKRIITGSSVAYNVDSNGNLRVGAAAGIGEGELERIDLCVRKGADVIVIDTAHADSKGVYSMLDMFKEVRANYSNIDIVAGNVSEADSAKRLTDAGADGIKVGQGPGSICTTRIVAGIGCPQVTAIFNCSKAIRGSGVPVCADGGIEYSGDITIAIASGAETVMLGNLLSGTLESPGDVILRQGLPVKRYRGMGSLGAMEKSKASRERYGQAECASGKLVPEGVEGVVPFKGTVAPLICQLLGGLRSGMGYLGASTILELQEKADFFRISGAGLGESHPHGITITEEAPNYRKWQGV
jgi:IMP dehydrogenase